MKILLLGSGGREHALAWKISQSKLCSKLFIAPGNAGTSQCGTNVNISVNDFEAIKEFCIQEEIKLIVVGPEEPLINGIYDFFEDKIAAASAGRKGWKGFVIGPSAKAAQLEGSKAFSKKFMQRHHIPTAKYAEFDADTFEDGIKYIQRHSLPVVLKADGLAAGKGVIICSTHAEALKVFEEMIIHKQFGAASLKVVVEEFLDGIEISVFALTDGKQYKIIGNAKDYKRIGEGDTGPNTGGMGCISPVPFADNIFMKKAEDRIIQPTIKGLKKEKFSYKGFIFFGLINVKGEPYIIEYNCRMGDPETEVVIPRLKNDLVELFLSLYNDKLKDIKVEYDERACATIVAVSKGYPGEYKKNLPVSGLDNFPVPQFSNSVMERTFSESFPSALVFQAGTKQATDNIVTNGGRVLAVTSFGRNIADAVKHSKKILEKIHFDGMYFRKDIGYEFEKDSEFKT